MTTPTLAQFAKALDAVRAKYPDAPGLPNGFSFILRGTMTIMTFQIKGCSKDIVPLEAALALCVTTAMEIAAWWEHQDFQNRTCFIGYSAISTGWRGGVWIRYTDESVYATEDIMHPSLPAAALAMLEVIGGGE